MRWRRWHSWTALGAVLLLVLGGGAYLMYNRYQAAQYQKLLPAPGPTVYVSNSKRRVGRVYNTQGVVQKIASSCQLQELQPDGSVQTRPSICDGGNVVVVGDRALAFQSGGPGENPYSVDLTDIHPGDTVYAQFVYTNTSPGTKNSHQTANLDCSVCYISKLSSAPKPATP